MPQRQKMNEREPILRRALMRVKPDYFSWSVEAQERYRVTMPENDTFHIQQVVLQDLFGMTLDTETQLEAALEQFTDAQYLRYNSTMLPIQGIGKDYFFLNESFGDKTILNFPTLYDYDYDDYCFQERVRTEEDAQHTTKPYRGNLIGRWARLSIDLSFPSSTPASFKMKTKQGDIYEGFGMDISEIKPVVEQERKSDTYMVKVDEWVRGTINGGGPEVVIQSYNGNIYIRKGK